MDFLYLMRQIGRVEHHTQDLSSHLDLEGFIYRLVDNFQLTSHSAFHTFFCRPVKTPHKNGNQLVLLMAHRPPAEEPGCDVWWTRAMPEASEFRLDCLSCRRWFSRRKLAWFPRKTFQAIGIPGGANLRPCMAPAYRRRQGRVLTFSRFFRNPTKLGWIFLQKPFWLSPCWICPRSNWRSRLTGKRRQGLAWPFLAGLLQSVDLPEKFLHGGLSNGPETYPSRIHVAMF